MKEEQEQKPTQLEELMKEMGVSYYHLTKIMGKNPVTNSHYYIEKIRGERKIFLAELKDIIDVINSLAKKNKKNVKPIQIEDLNLDVVQVRIR